MVQRAVSFCMALPLAVLHISVVLSRILLGIYRRELAHSEICFASAIIGGFPVTSDLSIEGFWGPVGFRCVWMLHALIMWVPASDVVMVFQKTRSTRSEG